MKCKKGEVVIHDGKKWIVTEVRIPSRKNPKSGTRTKAYVIACRLMDNGQILSRSPKLIGDLWRKA